MTALGPYEDDLEYLQDELAWIEARCRRLAAERELRQIEGAPATPRQGGSRGPPRLVRQRRRVAQCEEATARARIDRRRPQTEARPLALDRLAARCGLDELERLVLLLAMGPCLSRRFDDLYGQLVDEQFHQGLNVEVVFTFAGLGLAERVERRRVFGVQGALRRNDLITVNLGGRHTTPRDLLVADLDLTLPTFSHLVGRSEMADELLEFSSVEEPRSSFDRVVLPDEDRRRILSVVERHDEYLRCRAEWGFDELIPYGRGVLMLFHGKPGTGKTMTAHAVAQHLGKRIFNVDLPTFVSHREAERFLPALFREARLHDAVLLFDECEALLGSRQSGNQLMSMLLTEIERFEGVAILATNLPQVLDEALDRRILVKVRFPEPDAQARRQIWRAHLPDRAPLADDLDLAALAERYDLTGGYIKNAVLTTVADAVHRSRGHIDMPMLERAARAQVERPVDGASRMVRPAARLSDVCVPPGLGVRLCEIVAAARHQRTVLGRWGIGAHLGHGRGLAALLFGEPGTGKTLTAHAIAGELNRPLLPVSSPAILSRWVGEAERSLARAFEEAHSAGAVLLLDEVDSLLSERGRRNASRHDDSLVNALLQLLEAHDGLVLMATNRPGALDPALDRRLTWRLDLPPPDGCQRAAIWRRHLPDTAPVDSGVAPDVLGQRFRLSGGAIKNAVLRAALRAAIAGTPITQQLLVEAAAEQLGPLTLASTGSGS